MTIKNKEGQPSFYSAMNAYTYCNNACIAYATIVSRETYSLEKTSYLPNNTLQYEMMCIIISVSKDENKQ